MIKSLLLTYKSLIKDIGMGVYRIITGILEVLIFTFVFIFYPLLRPLALLIIKLTEKKRLKKANNKKEDQVNRMFSLAKVEEENK
jgi:hypothetical protein